MVNEHYSSCLMGMLYYKMECQCDYIGKLMSGMSSKETYVTEFGGEPDEDNLLP